MRWYGGFCALALSLAGCGSGGQQADVPDKPTFTEHIAPLIFKNCSPCHYDNGMAPFPLLTFEQVKKKARTIAKVTSKRIMPPWPADPSYTHFTGEKYLTAGEIATIQRWVETGAPQGPPDKLPTYQPPVWKSFIGKPDMVLPLEAIQLMPDLKDRFFIVKIPGMLNRDTWVRAVEFVAGTPDLVHHFNGHLLRYDWDKKKDPATGPWSVEITEGEYDQDFLKLNLLNDDGSKPDRLHSAVNYLPGVQGTAYPDGIGTFRLPRKFAFVGNDLHYGPSDRKVKDQSYINLFFTDRPPSRPAFELMLGTNGVSPIEPPLRIPADKKTKHTTRFQVNQDISVLTVNPHLHLLGTSFLGYAIKPNGDTVRLVRIPFWDFRWQFFYTFRHPVHIPAGSWIVAEATFDNTAANPHNPNRPPKEVGERLEYGGASMRAGDEMFQFILTWMPYRPGDEHIDLTKGER